MPPPASAAMDPTAPPAGPGTCCARCGGPFHCGAADPGPCACTTLVVTPATRDRLAARYTGCLCLPCLAAEAAADAVLALPTP